MSGTINKAKELISCYLQSNYSSWDLSTVKREIEGICGDNFEIKSGPVVGYDTLQEALGTLNEKEYFRKSKGVYYTPQDVVCFIINNSIKLYEDRLLAKDKSTLNSKQATSDTIFSKKIFDPTCGAGEFLVAFVNKMIAALPADANQEVVEKIVGNIFGNDINEESTTIAKLRILICIVHYFGVDKVKGISGILNRNFTNYDFVADNVQYYVPQFDYIVGNPPYVEDGKSGTTQKDKFGNIYCNVILNAVKMLNKDGVLGFIVPLSYVSTPRMSRVRELMRAKLSKQIVLSFADRPDCLFSSVHQKLCIIFGKEGVDGDIYTSGYHYWYKQERDGLFEKIDIIRNGEYTEGYIPKMSSLTDKSIFHKIQSQNDSLWRLINSGNEPVFLNMRACFWIKAFTRNHKGAEYKKFGCEGQSVQKYAMMLLNSSLFWWYWVSISDCWHITKKELMGFRIPHCSDYDTIERLVSFLENRLELTKKYVGTKQTDYEYKHKECLEEIDAIDRVVNKMFGLSDKESDYIIAFSKRYRVGGGAE